MQNDEVIEEALPQLTKNGKGDGMWFVRMAAINSIIKIKKNKESLQAKLTEKIETTEDSTEKEKLLKQKTNAKTLHQKIVDALKEIKAEETNSNLNRLLDAELK